MSIDISVPGRSGAQPGFAVQRPGNRLTFAGGRIARGSSLFGVTNDQNGPQVNAFPVSSAAVPGWTVYTFKASGTFLVAPGAEILADVFRAGGGGSGGGGTHGGGGGAGGFIDEHDVVIDWSDQGDGAVVVGAGGAEVPASAVRGNQGWDSSFYGRTAYGGGYGSREGGVNDYPPSDGASGGGAWPYEEIVSESGGITRYRGFGGQAIHGEQGHAGGPGTAASAWGEHTSGGGGGANWPGYGGSAPNGGLGRPCDIAGWGPDYAELSMRIVPWFCGGGAGKERPNNWGYMDGHPGYGGGGACGVAGALNSGGGGGGHGWYGSYTPPGEEQSMAYGPAGGSGIVIVRIPAGDERWIVAPRPVSYTALNEPVYPAHVYVTHVPADQFHLDTLGDESVVIWGWPPAPYDHYGWDGTSTPGL